MAPATRAFQDAVTAAVGQMRPVEILWDSFQRGPTIFAKHLEGQEVRYTGFSPCTLVGYLDNFVT